MGKTSIKISLTVAFAAALSVSAFFATATAEETADAPRGSRYSGQIEQCLKTPETQRGGINAFICPSGKTAGNNFDVAYQVILDLTFKTIDKDVESQIQLLKDSGASPVGDIGAQIAEWFDQGGTYTRRYAEACEWGVIREAIAHFGAVSTEGAVSKYLRTGADANACEILVQQKTAAYRDVAWIVAWKSVVKAYQDGKHKMMKDTKKAYERLQNKIMIMIGELSTIRDKMPSKTSTVIGS